LADRPTVRLEGRGADGAGGWLASACRLILNVRAGILLITLVSLREEEHRGLVVAALLVASVASLVPVLRWEKVGPILVRHPSYLAGELVLAALILILTGVDSPFFFFTLGTALLGGLVYGYPGAALFSTMLIVVYAYALHVRAPFDDTVTDFRTVVVLPALYPLVGVAGAGARRLLDRQAAAESALADQERTLAAQAERERLARDMHDSLAKTVHGIGFAALALSRRIRVAHDFPSDSLYRALRALNPSPYMYHLVLDGVEIVGSSPELLIRVSASGTVTLRPIAGTRRRGRSAGDDARMTEELINDEKERAEHLMLVDLGRNDVGRVASYGSVRVSDLMVIERYSHVLHLVSQVDGQLRPGLTAMDAFRAGFPAGTLTGAPKVRAMEIIDEMEPERRGPYGGAVGYISAGAKRMDLAITIRTCVIANGVASVQSAAGVVYDSVPEREFLEHQNKARALLTAIGQARAARARRS